MGKTIQEGLQSFYVVRDGLTDYFYAVEYRTIRSCGITALLPVRLREENNTTEVYYDITGKRSLEYCAGEQAFSFSRCKNIIRELLRMMRELEDHLLEPDYVCYDPANVYMSGSRLFWVYGPACERSIQEELEDFFSFLLTKLDYDDSEAVHFVYQVFWIVRKQGFSLELLEEILEGKSDIWESFEESGEDRYREFFEEHGPGDSLCENTDPDTSEAEEDLAAGGRRCSWKAVSSIIFLAILFAGSFAGAAVLMYFGYRSGLTGRGICTAAASLVVALCCLLFGIRVMKRCFFEPESDGAPGFRLHLDSSPYNDRDPDGDTGGWVDVDPVRVAFPVKEEGEDRIHQDRIHQDRMHPDEPPEIKGQPGYDISGYPVKLNPEAADREGTVILSMQQRRYPVLKSLETGDLIPVKEVPFYIGSDPVLNQMVLIDKTISRQHAVILQGKKNRYGVKDLGSTNGTWIKGIPVTGARPHELEDGCILCFAQKKYRFILPDSSGHTPCGLEKL